MIQFLVLLFGSRGLRRHWRALLLFGLFWMALGLLIFADALIDDIRIPPAFFTIPLIADGLWSLATVRNRSGIARSLRLGKAGVFLGIALLILTIPQHSGLAIGIAVGAFLCADAVLRGFSALVRRHARWQSGFIFALVEFVLGAWCFVPWPTHWEGEIGADVGTLLVLSAAGACSLALRIKRLRPDMPVLSAMNQGWPEASEQDKKTESDWEGADAVVHVWTPTGTLAPVHRGISRYFAARGKDGVISAGHAALGRSSDAAFSACFSI
ncbi:MAG: protease, partial [Deltaproteobacteria bacterium]|nr:protease [Deltaproteobacteria bacterium]